MQKFISKGTEIDNFQQEKPRYIKRGFSLAYTL